MTLPFLIALVCAADLTLTAGALAVALRRRTVAYTAIACGVVAIAYATAIFVLWGLWFVAPGCVINGCPIQPPPGTAIVYLSAGVAAQWVWMLGVALAVRLFARRRKFAHFRAETGM